ncbi:hypothetical protein, partial [Methylotuvimicrobium buryatense]
PLGTQSVPGCIPTQSVGTMKKRLLPKYRDVELMGAVAAMVMPNDVARYAYRKGLYVLAQSGNTVLIRNDGKFSPKIW